MRPAICSRASARLFCRDSVAETQAFGEHELGLDADEAQELAQIRRLRVGAAAVDAAASHEHIADAPRAVLPDRRSCSGR